MARVGGVQGLISYKGNKHDVMVIFLVYLNIQLSHRQRTVIINSK